MKIDGPSPVRKNAAAKKKDAAGAVGSSEFFSLLGAEETSSATASQPISDIQPSTSLNALLTLQEMPEDEVRERKAYKNSEKAIDTLEKLRHALLMGTVPANLLSELQTTVQHQQQKVNDPRLKAIMQDIELRAAVEMAKLERNKN